MFSQMNKGILFAVLSSLTFSFMNVLVKLISQDISSHEIVFFRGLIGALLALIFMKLKHVRFTNHNIPLLLLRGLLGGLYMVAYFFTISHMKLSDASILVHLTGFFTILFSSIFLKESLPKMSWIWIFLIVIGTSIIINPFSYTEYSFYALFGILSAALGSCAALTIRALARTKEHDSLEIIFYFLFTSALFGFLFMIQDGFIIPNLENTIYIILLGVVSFIAQVFLTGALGSTNAPIVEMVRYIGIFFNTLWGFLVFSESLTLYTILGGIIIVTATIMLSRKINSQ